MLVSTLLNLLLSPDVYAENPRILVNPASLPDSASFEAFFTPDGTHIVVVPSRPAYQHPVLIFDTFKGVQTLHIPGPVQVTGITPDGNTLKVQQNENIELISLTLSDSDATVVLDDSDFQPLTLPASKPNLTSSLRKASRAFVDTWPGTRFLGMHTDNSHGLFEQNGFLYLLDLTHATDNLPYEVTRRIPVTDGAIRATPQAAQQPGYAAIDENGNLSIQAGRTELIWNLRNGRVSSNKETISKSGSSKPAIRIGRTGSALTLTPEGLSAPAVYFLVNQLGEWLAYTPDGYYFGTDGFIDRRYFRYAEQLWPFETFDPLLHRPDVVLGRMRLADQDTLALYRNAYRKRLEKSGFTSSEIYNFTHQGFISPRTFQVRLADAKPGYVRTDNPYQKLTIETESLRVPALNDELISGEAAILEVFINGTPVSQYAGIALSQLTPTDTRRQNTEGAALFRDGIPYPAIAEIKSYPLDLHLAPGMNRIEIQVRGKDSAISQPVITDYYLDTETALPDLWFVGIGVSDYQDDRLDLAYAAKDVQDIARALSQTDAYQQVHQRLLLDNKVNQAAVQALDSWVSNARPDDHLIVAVAGHGTLSDSLEYLFMPYLTVPEDPEKYGIRLGEIESVLRSSPARQRLLFIDTCHSGEADASSWQEFSNSSQNPISVTARNVDWRGISFESVGPTDLPAPSAPVSSRGTDDSFSLMKELFLDTRRGSGTNILTSAAGFEFAMESDEWRNGVFTFALLKTLNTPSADTDLDGVLQISELQSFSAELVTGLTGGYQTPTYRQVNRYNDFPITHFDHSAKQKKQDKTMQRDVSGRLLDASSGEGIAGASVYCPDTRTGATADIEGYFSFFSIPLSGCRIEATGYEYRKMRFKVSNQDNLQIRLKPR
ncbi:MAG: caspase family protein [Pseudomonadales bacterium]|nr:caspase family protein [Pseudomonadales bacterium]